MGARSFLNRSYAESEEPRTSFTVQKPNWNAVLNNSERPLSIDVSSAVTVLDEFSALSRYPDPCDDVAMKEILVGDQSKGFKLATSLLSVFEYISDASVLVFSLHLAEQFVLGDSERYDFFTKTDEAESKENGEIKIIPALVSLLSYSDATVAGRSAHLASLFLSFVHLPLEQRTEVSPGAVTTTAISSSLTVYEKEMTECAKKLLVFIFEKLRGLVEQSESNRLAPPVPAGFNGAILALSVLLRNPGVRCILISSEHDGAAEDAEKTYAGFKLLLECSSLVGSNMTSLYNLLLCIWLLTFNREIRSNAFSAPEINMLMNILKSEPFEKVIRICLAVIRLVLTEEQTVAKASKAGISLGEAGKGYTVNVLSEVLISLNALRLLDLFKEKKALVKDVELYEDLLWIHETLVTNYKVLTTFDRHEKELMTEKLHWSNTVHSEAFWKENARVFEKNNFSSIKKLIKLLKSNDSTTAAIACYDLGHFVQYYPNGKLIVENFGGKSQIMMLLQHESPEVQKQALTACSKIMINNWKSVVATK